VKRFFVMLNEVKHLGSIAIFLEENGMLRFAQDDS
jgi:hypothetical protein